MSALQLPLIAQAHNNQQLFSDYYLNVTLPQRADWQALVATARPAMAQIAAIFGRYTPSHVEAQIEHDLVQPILEVLEHTFEVQAALKAPDGTKRPDYIFYRGRTALDANKNKTLTEALLAPGGVAVGDAKHWDRPLDIAVRTQGGDPFTNRNPAYQIAFYIQHSGLEWGILTNGRLWRLYHKETAHKLNRYYEVDLAALLATNDPAQFLYFYAFFHRAAFEEHPLGVAALLQESNDYAQGVGDSLKVQVYTALRHVAQGFLDDRGNNLQADPATLKEIYDNSLIVLYRLLFILYAEARGLLPIRENPMYRSSYSLRAITHQIAEDLRQGRQLLATGTRLWHGLKELFHFINDGNPELQVATYNGGLFDPGRHPFLERHTVGDAHLRQAIDTLARVRGQFVDYRDLAERHLGTIYEGLLEYHLEAIVPEEGWTIAVLNDKGERRATGSYYTPGFVVRYIVDQAVGPMLEEAVRGKESDAEKIAAVLDVNVLDPAMGSGYFLVEVAEYIARFLVDLAVTPDADAHGEADLAYWKRRVAQNCIYGVDLNPLAVELAKLSLWLVTAAKDRPLSFLDHHLRAGNSLIGASIADLQIASRRALARSGRKAQQAVAAGQLSMLGDPAFQRSLGNAVSAMWQIEGAAGDTIAEVKEQERAYEQLRGDLNRKYGRLADLATATHFGLDIERALWSALTDFATGRAIAGPPIFNEWLDRAARFSQERQFFHWELEFPEVFFDRMGEPLGEGGGFDAVIGNPPYVRQEQMGPLKPYLSRAYHAVYDGVADLYVYFYHLGLEALRMGGRMSYIVTNKWLRAGYGQPLRRYFAGHADIERIIDFGHAPIFPDADVFPVIVVLRKPEAQPTTPGTRQTQVCLFPREALGTAQIANYVQDHGYSVASSRFGPEPWSLEPSEVDDLLRKFRHAGVPLAEFTGVKPLYGIKTGLNEAFLIDTPTKEALVREDPNSAQIIKPYLRGQDIKRWVPEWAGLWMIFARKGIDITRYPAIERHLTRFRGRLEPKPKTWTGGAWAGRKAGAYQWYELQDPVEYWPRFEEPKLTIQRIAFHSRIGFDDSGMYVNDAAIVLPTSDSWLLACLNSPAMWYFLFRNLPHKKDEALAMDIAYVESLPIAPASDSARGEGEAAVRRLITLSQERRASQRDILEWLRVEFGVASPGQRLEAIAALDEASFIEEVRRRRPRAAGRLTPAALRDLRDTYGRSMPTFRNLGTEVVQLEHSLAALVNDAYGLIPEEVDLLWRTAPPRMPLRRSGASAVSEHQLSLPPH